MGALRHSEPSVGSNPRCKVKKSSPKLKFVRPATAATAWNVSQSTLRRRAADGALDRVPDPGSPGQFLYALPTAEQAKALVPRSPTPVSRAKRMQFDEDEDLFENDVPQPVASPRSKAGAGLKTIAAFFDVHRPIHDPVVWKVWLMVLKDLQPDEVIYPGDYIDAECLSSHPPQGGEVPTWKEELDDGRKGLIETQRAAPNAQITLMGGNHEDRARRFTAAKASMLRGIIDDIPGLMKLRELGVKWVPYGQDVYRGEMTFGHGFYFNKHHAYSHLGPDGYDRSCTYGHTHRPQSVHLTTGSGRLLQVYGMPCGRRVDDVSYMKGKPTTGWVQGFGIYFVAPDGQVNAYPVIVQKGRAIWNGKLYDGND